MSIITGTAVTKNTPLKVLKELEYVERKMSGRKENDSSGDQVTAQQPHDATSLQARQQHPHSISIV